MDSKKGIERKGYQLKYKVYNAAMILVIGVGIIACPLLVNEYIVYIMILGLINIIVAMHVNLLIGYTGQVSLGQAAFLATGAYTTAIFSGMFGYPFLLVMFISGVVAAILGFAVGLPALRLRGLYLAVSTLAFHTIISYLIASIQFLGGSGGILVGSPIVWDGYAITSRLGVYYIALGTTILSYVIVRNIIRSKEGRALISVRDNELVAAALGVATYKYKLKAFAISSFFTGIAGSLYGLNIQFIDSDHFSLEVAIIAIGMAVVGGMGTEAGPILGGIFFTALPEGIRLLRTSIVVILPQIAGRFEDVFVMVNGVIIVLFLIAMPRGLAGLMSKDSTLDEKQRGGDNKFRKEETVK